MFRRISGLYLHPETPDTDPSRRFSLATQLHSHLPHLDRAGRRPSSLGHLGVLHALPLHVLEEAAVVHAPHGLPRQVPFLVPRQHVQDRPLQLRREPAMLIVLRLVSRHEYEIIFQKTGV